MYDSESGVGGDAKPLASTSLRISELTSELESESSSESEPLSEPSSEPLLESSSECGVCVSFN